LKKAGEVLWQREGTSITCVRGRGRFLDVGEDLDVREVCAKGGEQLELSGAGIGVWCNDDNAVLNGMSAVGHRSTRGDGGRDLQSEEGFATAVIAIQERNAGEGETVLPEPDDRFGWGSRQSLFIDRKGEREWIVRGLWSFGGRVLEQREEGGTG